VGRNRGVQLPRALQRRRVACARESNAHADRLGPGTAAGACRAWRVAVFMECRPNRAGLWQQQATVELSNIGSAGSARSAGLTERLPIVCAQLSLLRVHIRLTAIHACPRTCIRGKGTRDRSARKEALLVCFQVKQPLRTSKPRHLESQDGRNTPPRPSPSACRPQALAADAQVPLALPCTGRLLVLRYCIHAPPEAGGAPTFGAIGPIVGTTATCHHSTAVCAIARVRADEAQTF
jgi:hypothetical protein